MDLFIAQRHFRSIQDKKKWCAEDPYGKVKDCQWYKELEEDEDECGKKISTLYALEEVRVRGLRSARKAVVGHGAEEQAKFEKVEKAVTKWSMTEGGKHPQR